ncbi:hypothetical protein L873DRAFT_1929333 [Choiromyces venosus 120613-1]|uniref:Uncharacterized protein n=1 Tax=Choiromyces venosus 120613-1 TaxID=1336337 RepID=A0A3N4JHA5_9PEZI|nr:hypothetical protein L873DRAFT_1929333 [Choiromyces venosus 120613-1]
MVLMSMTMEHQNGCNFQQTHSMGKKLLDLSMSNLDHCDMPWTDIAKEVEIKAAQSTIENLFHSYNVFRYVAYLKPTLTQQMRDNRVDLAKLGMTIDICQIVSTNEM